MAHIASPFSPVVDGEVLPVAPWQALAAGAAWHVDLLTGHNRDEYRLFTVLYGLRGQVTDEAASWALHGLAGADGEAAYREAYPDADAETLFELVYSDWLFRMPTLHLAQAHAAAGGRTFLYQVSYPASEGGLGAGPPDDPHLRRPSGRGPVPGESLTAHLGPAPLRHPRPQPQPGISEPKARG